LLGVYFDDEPGGKMLDSTQVNLYDNQTGGIITKSPMVISVKYPKGYNSFQKDGSIYLEDSNTAVTYNTDSSTFISANISTHNPTYFLISANQTAYVVDSGQKIISQVTDPNVLPQVPTYQEALAKKPFQNYNETERIFVGTIQNSTSWPHSQVGAKLFTSDYALQWFDYKGGYDVVFTEFGWNHSIAQAIAQARGAANVMEKDWGAIVTWKYTYPESVHSPSKVYGPYLPSGDEVYRELRMAYEAGAKYLVLFNYPTYPAGNLYGVLQDEHFTALQRLWTDTINNQTVVHGGVEAEAALVLPGNYGWGMRNPQDNIWGLWQADSNSQLIWNALQEALATYGSRLDVVFQDSAYPVEGRYQNIIYAPG
jgi:hypothetical protein